MYYVSVLVLYLQHGQEKTIIYLARTYPHLENITKSDIIALSTKKHNNSWRKKGLGSDDRRAEGHLYTLGSFVSLGAQAGFGIW